MEFIDIPTEQTTATTDLLLALVALASIIYLARIGGQDPWKVRIWSWAFGLLVFASGMVAVVCGVLPALQATRMNLVPDLQTAGRSARLAGIPVSRLMTIGQIAAALMLIVAGGLLIRTVRDARSLEIARDPERLLVARPNLIGAGFSREESTFLIEALLEQTRSLPMIQSAALVHRRRREPHP